jgi:hypothetical protein
MTSVVQGDYANTGVPQAGPKRSRATPSITPAPTPTARAREGAEREPDMDSGGLDPVVTVL